MKEQNKVKWVIVFAIIACVIWCALTAKAATKDELAKLVGEFQQLDTTAEQIMFIVEHKGVLDELPEIKPSKKKKVVGETARQLENCGGCESVKIEKSGVDIEGPVLVTGLAIDYVKPGTGCRFILYDGLTAKVSIMRGFMMPSDIAQGMWANEADTASAPFIGFNDLTVGKIGQCMGTLYYIPVKSWRRLRDVERLKGIDRFNDLLRK